MNGVGREQRSGKTQNVKGGIHMGRLAVFYRNDPARSRDLLKPSRPSARSRSLVRTPLALCIHVEDLEAPGPVMSGNVFTCGLRRPRASRVSPFALLRRMFDLLSSTCYSPLCRTFRLSLGVVLLMSRSHGRRSV